MSAAGKRVAVLCEQQYQEMELWYPVYRLREAGARVTVVAPKADTEYKSKLGYPAKSEAAAESVSAADFDAVIVPGGFAPDYMRRHKAMVRLVKEAAEAGKPVAAICHGGWMLCSAGVLRGRRATSFFAIADDLRNAGAEWVDAEVVTDGPLITSRTPEDLPAFMRAVLKGLGG
jgi:protease I